MTAREFKRIAFDHFGPRLGWQTRTAEYLGVDRATVSRYVNAHTQVPNPVAKLMEQLNDQVLRSRLR